MRTIHKHDEWEREFCTRFVQAVNQERGTDYRSVEVTTESFPDFHLVSRLGHQPLDVEVVTVPISDFTARRDTGVQARLRRDLQEKIEGPPGLVIQVNLRKEGLQRKLPSQVFSDLVGVVQKLIANRHPKRGNAVKKIGWEEHSALSQFVSRVSVQTLTKGGPMPIVGFPLWHWAPCDCQWIIDGIQHKLCYAEAVIRSTILIVGDAALFGDRKVVQTCKEEGQFLNFPFKEIWFASSFFPIPGITRLK